MMKGIIRLILILLLLALTSIAAYSETRYVSDELIITIRAGKGDQFRIIDYLKSNTPLEVLSEEDEYLFVRTPEGDEGWVRTRYITSELPKEHIIANLKREIETMKVTVIEAKDSIADSERLQAENESLIAENKKLEEDLERIERKEMIHWFLAGASVLFIGWLIGRISRQKRYY